MQTLCTVDAYKHVTMEFQCRSGATEFPPSGGVTWINATCPSQSNAGYFEWGGLLVATGRWLDHGVTSVELEEILSSLRRSIDGG